MTKMHTFGVKMQQTSFDGRDPPEPDGGAYSAPQTSYLNARKGDRKMGKTKRKCKEKEREGMEEGREGKAEKGKGMKS